MLLQAFHKGSPGSISVVLVETLVSTEARDCPRHDIILKLAEWMVQRGKVAVD